MSVWSYISGTVIVRALGSTIHEEEYILHTVLSHLPRVGSEGDMNTYVNRKKLIYGRTYTDEFGQKSNLIGEKGREIDLRYIITLDASLRNVGFQGCVKKFVKWLNRLSKRIYIEDILVKIEGCDNHLIIDDPVQYQMMYECGDINSEDKSNINWCDYMRWERAENSDLPKVLRCKYDKYSKKKRKIVSKANYYSI
ncbi:MAG: hypothetical protein ACLTBR_03105 [Anaerostipes sp.]|uniref:hypothetical protein n=1 Tax=Anaerostipes sp. TaxID=1872530 RepID=UPI003994891E